MRTPAILVLVFLAASVIPHAAALPTPGLFCDPADMTLGRLFPEAMQTNDYVSYEEAICGLDKLQAAHPDSIQRDVVAKSAGWPSITGSRDQFDVFVVRVSNYASATPDADKVRLLFQLSIHGNEKGGREGGLRVIEDLVRDLGMAKAHPELRSYLDYMELLFAFPNPDGWRHEELQYRHADACYISLTCTPGQTGAETQNFVRTNGNGFDVNRQWPTAGWVRERYQPMSQPEAIGLIGYLKNFTHVKYASDIHGMLNPADGTTPALGCAFGMQQPTDADPVCFVNAVAGAQGHFVLTMLPAGRQNSLEMTGTTALAELVKERLNSNPFYAEWRALPSVQGAWGGEFNDWGTVWDTIGYTDSGFTSDFYSQDHGINAMGVSFELSYNHITFDNYYPGVAQRINAYHVENVRDIVRAFMDQANLDIQMTLDVKGTRTAFLENPFVLTNAGDMKVTGWAQENPNDDMFDAAHRVFRAAPNDYFTDLQRYVRDGDKPGILDALRPADLTAANLARYDNLVIAGSSWKSIESNAAALSAIKAWVEAGGKLVLTDEALQAMAALGIVEGADVGVHYGYAGATNFVDKSHDLVANVRGLARETYEPVPLGFGVDGLNAPVWFVKAKAFGGEVVGLAGEGQGARPNKEKVNFGRVALGSGTVVFLGAVLPDPTNENGAPYGADSYATTYTGNQLLRNMLGWDVIFTSADLVVEDLGKTRAVQGDAVDTASSQGVSIPGAPIVALLAGLVVLALARRRRD